MKTWNRAALAAVAGMAALVVGMTAPAMAGEAGAPAAHPATAPHVWVKDCPPAKFTMHPASFTVACADGNTYFTHLVWSGWGTSKAVGRGTLWANTCTPNCASGKYVSEAGTLTLSRIAKHDGRKAYGHAYVKPLAPNKHHFTAFGYKLAYP